jgi:glycosyltransferase involved in cell wall biosynthesis
MSISIIIPTRNRASSLVACLSSLLPQLTKGDEVLVVDNASKDNTGPRLRSLKTDKQLRYLYEPNIGPSFARNRGFRSAKNTIIAFLDDDCIVSDKWLDVIKTTTKSEDASRSVFLGKIIHVFPSSGVLETLFLLRHKDDWQKIKAERSWKTHRYVHFLHAGNFFAKKSVLDTVHPLFDEVNFPFMGEERDLTYRLQINGIPIKYIQSVSVTHHKTHGGFLFSMRSVILTGIALGKLKKKYLADNKTRSIFGNKENKHKPETSFYRLLYQNYKDSPFLLFTMIFLTLIKTLFFNLSANLTFRFYKIPHNTDLT